MLLMIPRYARGYKAGIEAYISTFIASCFVNFVKGIDQDAVS